MIHSALEKPVDSKQIKDRGEFMADEKTLYARLGGYDAIAAVADNLVPSLDVGQETGTLLGAPQT